MNMILYRVNLCRITDQRLLEARSSHIAILTPKIWPFVKNDILFVGHAKLVVLVEPSSIKNLKCAFKIISVLDNEKQVVIISNVWPISGRSMANYHLKNPYVVQVGEYRSKQFECLKGHCIYFENEENKIQELIQFVRDMAWDEKTVVFCKDNSYIICEELSRQDVIHSVINQESSIELKDRAEKLFNRGPGRVLVIDSVPPENVSALHPSKIINFNMPKDMAEMLQRLNKIIPGGSYINYITEADSKHIIRDLMDFMQEVYQPPSIYELALINRKYDVDKYAREGNPFV